ncbi:MAG TPA: hypothetical protein VGG83_10810 [Trebonia sp.]|jgi:hypothetical protein
MATAQDQRDATDRHAQVLLAIEQAAVRAATLRLVIALAQLQREVTGRLLMARSDQAKAAAAKQLAIQLEAEMLPLLSERELLPPILAQARAAMDATAVFTLGPGNPFVPVAAAPREVTQAVRSATASARVKVDRSAKMLQRSSDLTAAATALNVAQQAIGSVATGAEWAVNDAGNRAAARIAQATGQKLVWVPERDACVVCLALSGDVVDPMKGESFDEFATFGATTPPSVWPPGMPLIGPPRHPHCRCIAQVWNGSAVGGMSWPERLKHEALRSIARGFSLPSESQAARLRAAERILRDGRAGQLPKSVQAYAERAVGRRKFETRTVPSHTVRTRVR